MSHKSVNNAVCALSTITLNHPTTSSSLPPPATVSADAPMPPRLLPTHPSQLPLAPRRRVLQMERNERNTVMKILRLLKCAKSRHSSDIQVAAMDYWSEG